MAGRAAIQRCAYASSTCASDGLIVSSQLGRAAILPKRRSPAGLLGLLIGGWIGGCTLIEPKTTTVDQLAKRWSLEPTQILEAAIGGQIGLYFRLGYCVVADLPNLSPGRLLLRPYQGELQVDIPTLQCILYHGEARNVQEAYLPGGGRVYVELPPKEGPPGVQLTTPLNIKIENLSALMDEVKAHELKVSGAVVEGTGVDRSKASAPGVDSASKAHDTSKGTPPKLSQSAKSEVIRLYDRGRGVSVNRLAKQFGVSNPTIDKVLKRAGVKV